MYPVDSRETHYAPRILACVAYTCSPPKPSLFGAPKNSLFGGFDYEGFSGLIDTLLASDSLERSSKTLILKQLEQACRWGASRVESAEALSHLDTTLGKVGEWWVEDRRAIMRDAIESYIDFHF